MLRPVARLRFELDGDLINDELTDDLKRCFLNVAPLQVVRRPAVKDGQPASNILVLMVELREPYWDVDETWTDVVLPWVEKKLYKLNATVQNYNRTRADCGHAIDFGQLEIVLGDRVVALELPASSEFPTDAAQLVDRARSWSGAGRLPSEGFLRVEVPFRTPDEARLARERAAEACGDASRDVWGVRDERGGLRAFDAAEGARAAL